MKQFIHERNPLLRHSRLKRSLLFLLLFLSEEDLLDDAFAFLDTCSKSGMMEGLDDMFPGAFR